MEGDRRVAVCKTAAMNIEQTRFINEQQQFVVKSRGNHGLATVKLSDTSNGAEQDRVLAYEMSDGRSAWAPGMDD
jgi:hypothetical protein